MKSWIKAPMDISNGFYLGTWTKVLGSRIHSCWNWSSNTLATWCQELTHWKRSWCWERLKAKEEGSSRGWDSEIVLPTKWTWIWANSGRYGKGHGSLVCFSLWGQRESYWTTTITREQNRDIGWQLDATIRLHPMKWLYLCISWWKPKLYNPVREGSVGKIENESTGIHLTIFGTEEIC